MTGQPRPGQPDWIEPEQWYAQLATQYAAAGALLTDPAGQVLLVKPNYREYWTLPGGMVDHGETPEQALRRELKEELGLDLAVGRLLVIDWAPAYSRRPRPIAYFLFDAGVLDSGTAIRLQEAELDEYAYVAPGRVAAEVASYTAARVPAALSARATGTTIYLPQQARSGT